MSTNNRNSASLGRGLDALFPNDFVNIKKVETGGSSSISELPLNAIYPNPDQPRADFDAETLEELASSIKHIGSSSRSPSERMARARGSTSSSAASGATELPD